ncbi:MAG: Spy/CpxP family protein refolding chaperone [Pseudolabrys sp.]
MKMLVAFAFAVVTTVALAQSPYAGMQARPVKALSAEQIADLKAGRGMGRALAAELNGYPGPSHLLELADQLQLSPEQRASISRLFDTMKQEAIPLGEQLLEQESELDRQFAGHGVTPESLKAAISAIAATQASLRETHLKYHLRTGAFLSPHQLQQYSELRGYGGRDSNLPHHRH